MEGPDLSDSAVATFAQQLADAAVSRLRSEGLMPLKMLPAACSIQAVDGCQFHSLVLATAYDLEKIVSIQRVHERLQKQSVACDTTASPLYGTVLALFVQNRPQVRLVVPYVCRDAAALCPLSRWVLRSKAGEAITIVAGQLHRRNSVAPILLYPGAPEELALPDQSQQDLSLQLEVDKLPASWCSPADRTVVEHEVLACRLQSALAELQDADWLCRFQDEVSYRRDGPLTRALVFMSQEGGGLAPSGIYLRGSCIELASAAHRVLRGGFLSGCRQRVSKVRWGELALPRAQSWEAFEQQIAMALEQVVLDSCPHAIPKPPPKLRTPKVRKALAAPLNDLAGSSDGLPDNLSEETGSTLDVEEETDDEEEMGESVVDNAEPVGTVDQLNDEISSPSDEDGLSIWELNTLENLGRCSQNATPASDIQGTVLREAQEDQDMVADFVTRTPSSIEAAAAPSEAMSLDNVCNEHGEDLHDFTSFSAPPGLAPPPWMCRDVLPSLPPFGTLPPKQENGTACFSKITGSQPHVRMDDPASLIAVPAEKLDLICQLLHAPQEKILAVQQYLADPLF